MTALHGSQARLGEADTAESLLEEYVGKANLDEIIPTLARDETAARRIETVVQCRRPETAAPQEQPVVKCFAKTCGIQCCFTGLLTSPEVCRGEVRRSRSPKACEDFQ